MASDTRILDSLDGNIDAGVNVTIDKNISTHLDEPNRKQECIEDYNAKPIKQRIFFLANKTQIFEGKRKKLS